MASPTDQHHSLRSEVEGAFGKVSTLLKASLGPINAKYPYLPTNENFGKLDKNPLGGVDDIDFDDVRTLLNSFCGQAKGVQDDSTLLLERLIDLLSKVPTDSKISKDLSDSFINQLWGALPHPPVASLGSKYKYREADGGNNNINIPDLGRAGSPYARSAKPEILQNIALPDPGDLFDSLMDRGDKFEPHPNKISSMLFYLASIIIHDLFRTSHEDYTISLTSSYLDLAPLYGSNEAEQNSIRTHEDGLIKPDCFSEKRLLGFPPGVGGILIMFNRFHNNTVKHLALINENGRFTKPGPDEKDKLAKYDNDLFQTGRLITCGLYVNMILKDYVRTILSLNRTNSTWDLDPRAQETKTLFNTPAPEACGNSCSAEFNLIYRWHSAISERDDKWTQAEYKRLFPGKNPEEISLRELLGGLRGLEKSLEVDPFLRPFAGLTREEDGRFSDADLVRIIGSSVEDVAGSFGANKVPTIMKSVEILGIMQARSWNMASLNEFREYFGLTKHETFEDINPDPVVANKLRNLYDSPDFVELYPGLVAEKAKPPMAPGSGLCVNYTISRAILSDAVALVRGDRFYTTDFTPKALTNWGYQACNYDLTVDQGHVAYKLILGAFPTSFKGNSVYAHFPFVVPSENEKILKKLGTHDLYDFSTPKVTPELIVIDSYAAAVKILEDKVNWKVTWGEGIAHLVSQPGEKYGVDYCLAGDAKPNEASRNLVMNGLYPKDWHKQVKQFYQDKTAELLKKYTYKLNGFNQVDIIRDVSILAHTHFSASLFSLPLKTESNPLGIYTEQELSQVLSVLFFAIFYDIDPVKSFMLRNAAKTLAQQLGSLILFNVSSVAKFGLVADLVEKLHQKSALTEYGTHMIHRLLDGGLSIKDVVWGQLLPTAASMVANQSQLFSQVLDYYFTDGNAHLPAMTALAHSETPEAEEKLLKYFMEGARLRATAGLFRDAATDQMIHDGGRTVAVPRGRRILVNMVKASRDPVQFPDPLEIRLDRPLESYIHYGWGPHQCAGLEASKVAIVTMLRAVLRLKNVRPAPGPQGVVKKVPADYGYTTYLTQDWGAVYPIPTTMKIRWDN